MPWTLRNQPVTDPSTTGLYALVNTTGADAYGVTLLADDVAAREVFNMNAPGLVLSTQLVSANDEIGTVIDLSRGYADGGHITVTWGAASGAPEQTQTIALHQHRD